MEDCGSDQGYCLQKTLTRHAVYPELKDRDNIPLLLEGNK